MDIKKQYDAIAHDYIEGQKKFFSNTIDEARVFLKSQLGDLDGKNVLDLGCGGGTDIVSYEDLGATLVYGIDSSSAMIEEAKRVVRRPDLLCVGDIETLPFESATFDVVTARYSIHYLENFDRTYTEIARVLKLGGLLVIVAPHPMRDVVQKKEKIYGKRELLTVGMYDDHVSLMYPSYTLSDYLSKTFFELFYPNALFENNLENGKETPNTLGFTAIRK